MVTLLSILGTAFLGALGWAFVRTERHETRITQLETQSLGLKDYLTVRFDNVEGRLDRIEKNQDGK